MAVAEDIVELEDKAETLVEVLVVDSLDKMDLVVVAVAEALVVVELDSVAAVEAELVFMVKVLMDKVEELLDKVDLVEDMEQLEDLVELVDLQHQVLSTAEAEMVDSTELVVEELTTESRLETSLEQAEKVQ